MGFVVRRQLKVATLMRVPSLSTKHTEGLCYVSLKSYLMFTGAYVLTDFTGGNS